jgi:hypothetical protein
VSAEAVGDKGVEHDVNAAMLDPDYMAMVLAMDTLWASGEPAAPDGLNS